jgi:hypothetical protein
VAPRFIAAVLLICVPYVPSRGDSAEPQPVAAAFDLLPTKHMVIMVRINGKGPYRMIFDTGAPLSLVNSRVAKATGLTSATGALPGLSLFGPLDQTKIKELEIGDLRASDVPVVVMDHPTVELVSRILGPVEGIIGFPFFARYRMTLDYQAKQLTFVPNGFQPTDILQALLASLMGREKPVAVRLAPPALWGLVPEKEQDDERSGVTIKQVLQGGAAARAGVQAGDRLLTLDDYWTDTVHDCYAAASQISPGNTVKVVIERNSRKMVLSVTPAAGL